MATAAAALLVGGAGAASARDPFSNPFLSRDDYDRAPVGTIRKAPPRAAAPQSSAVMRGSGGAANWSAEGGTTVTVGAGESVGVLSSRYGVPTEALLKINNLSSASQAGPGTRIVIPVYRAGGGAAHAAARPASSSSSTIKAEPLAPPSAKPQAAAAPRLAPAKPAPAKVAVKTDARKPAPVKAAAIKPAPVKAAPTVRAARQEPTRPATRLTSEVRPQASLSRPHAPRIDPTPTATVRTDAARQRLDNEEIARLKRELAESRRAEREARSLAESARIETRAREIADDRQREASEAGHRAEIMADLKAKADARRKAREAAEAKLEAERLEKSYRQRAKAEEARKAERARVLQAERERIEQKRLALAEAEKRGKEAQRQKAAQEQKAAERRADQILAEKAAREKKLLAQREAKARQQVAERAAKEPRVRVAQASADKEVVVERRIVERQEAPVKEAPVKTVAAEPRKIEMYKKPQDIDPTPTASLPTASEEKDASDKGEFRWPARGRVISSFKAGQNDGVNISVPEGTAVKAAEAGVVTYAGSELKGYGNLVLIRHPNGFVSAYAHNSSLDVKKGDAVQRGQTIARAGRTGDVTAPQVHFEIRKGTTPVDPANYLAGL